MWIPAINKSSYDQKSRWRQTIWQASIAKKMDAAFHLKRTMGVFIEFP